MASLRKPQFVTARSIAKAMSPKAHNNTHKAVLNCIGMESNKQTKLRDLRNQPSKTNRATQRIK